MGIWVAGVHWHNWQQILKRLTSGAENNSKGIHFGKHIAERGENQLRIFDDSHTPVKYTIKGKNEKNK